jgi:hypothetical protein
MATVPSSRDSPVAAEASTNPVGEKETEIKGK